MRELIKSELGLVSGAGTSPTPPTCYPDPRTKARKGNNGFGNGADANTAAPGGSGTSPGNKDGSNVR